jgi:hypothetical protein
LIPTAFIVYGTSLAPAVEHMVKPSGNGQLSTWRVIVAFLAVLGAFTVSAALPGLAGSPDRWFESITIQGVTYQQVTLFSQTETDVILKHDQGLTGLKVAQLDNPTLRRFGYHVDEPDAKPAVAGNVALEFLSGLLRMAGLEQWTTFTLIGLVVLTMGIYIYTSYLFWLICVKTEVAPGILVWLPFLQFFPLLRAARMSSLWAVAVILFVLGTCFAVAQWPQYALWLEIVSAISMLGVWSTWAVHICRARSKGIVTVILLMVPGTNYLALLYLAGSK